jgi:hypothetical protein
VEGLFSEICIQRRSYNAASEPEGSILNAATLDDRFPHVVVLDRYTGRECFAATLALDRFTHVSCEALQSPEADARISTVRLSIGEEEWE